MLYLILFLAPIQNNSCYYCGGMGGERRFALWSLICIGLYSIHNHFWDQYVSRIRPINSIKNTKMSTENNLANKKRREKLPSVFYSNKLCYCRTSICNISFYCSKRLVLSAGNSLVKCQKMEWLKGVFLLLLEHFGLASMIFAFL
jgi:hypothetical protein